MAYREARRISSDTSARFATSIGETILNYELCSNCVAKVSCDEVFEPKGDEKANIPGMKGSLNFLSVPQCGTWGLPVWDLEMLRFLWWDLEVS